jgi:anti-sigma regulatory factor (Ser/Thr protein kinase)
MELKYQIEGGNFIKAGHASSEVKKVLKQLNLDTRLIKRVVVALYEAEVNVVAHAEKGEMIVSINGEKIHVVIDDSGPGIENLELAMQEGYSTASQKVREMGFGAGMGLPNIKRNTDELNIVSEPGTGTRVEMITYLAEKKK